MTLGQAAPIQLADRANPPGLRVGATDGCDGAV